MEMNSCRITREAYRGPANRNIWVYDTKTKRYQQITQDEGQDIYPAWGANNTLFFLSARTGRYNIYSLQISNGSVKGSPKALTNYKDEGIRYFSLSAKSNRIVYERDMNLYLTDTKGGKGKALKIDVTKDYRFDPMEHKIFTSSVSGYDVSPNGKYMALTVRGEIFVMPEDKDKKRAIPIAGHPYREQDVNWLNDSTLLFISDRAGNRDIYLAHSAKGQDSDLYKVSKRKLYDSLRLLRKNRIWCFLRIVKN